MARLYAKDYRMPPDHPFPPAILTTGTRDMLLSDTVLLHRALRRAGIPAELHVTEAAGHGGFMGMAPEDQEILREVRRFAETHWAAPARQPLPPVLRFAASARKLL
jgi:acetyl esterase/lipase